MANYKFENKKFNIQNYNRQSPFSNFLPGVAGKMGIPLWVFYLNRGQGICGYGLQDKNHPIMAFTPANKAYETAPITGFRTFIKSNDDVYEAFHVDSDNPHEMNIDMASFSIIDHMKALNVSVKVTYFGLSNEPLGGLIRKVELSNLNDDSLDLEILDGIAEILPAGIQNAAYKSTSNILASWADVKHLDEDLPFFTLRASTGDSSEVKKVEEGHFYFGGIDNQLIQPIVDPELIFGMNTAKTKPNKFMDHSLDEIQAMPQNFTNQFACAFLPIKLEIGAHETVSWYALSGHADHYEKVKKLSQKVKSQAYIDLKYKEAFDVINMMLEDVDSETAYPIFDEYIKQNYLDNILRGGYPEAFGDTIYHLYSRRHGDLERDYNFFSLAPEYFSQGNGNFRDVCQNRRLDSFFNRDVKDFNVFHFLSLIQMDGYNPLSINGMMYKLKDDVDQKTLIDQLFEGQHDVIANLLSHPFTPGTIVNFIEKNEIKSKVSIKDYLDQIILHSEPFIQAGFGEGFWIDHFTYVLDLVESYKAIYPDKMEKLLYDNDDYLYFDSPVSIRKKADKIVINNEGAVRQYGSLIHFDDEKVRRLGMNPHGSNWIKMNGQRYHSNLFTKLLILVLNKHSLLDPDGIGIEMEAGKPGWNDAMNGLPGLLGSGVSETIELHRIVDFLLNYVDHHELYIPIEVSWLFESLIQENNYQERLRIRETYRDKIRFGLSGEFKIIKSIDIKNYLINLRDKLFKGIESINKDQIIPTFLRYDVEEYEKLEGLYNEQGYPLVKPTKYKRIHLTPFLEAPARLMKLPVGKDALASLHEMIKHSDLFDKKLKMFKTSGDLTNETHEIGRIHAFTKGWLERESNFLHMSYKYLLGLLKAGLYDDFYEEIKSNLVCFMDPEIYKRSTLENSSFIATSNNPNPSIHGKGYFARLSGSTVEAVNMWTVMMTGGQPFEMIDGELVLNFKPKLHASFFKKDHTVSFKFLKDIKVTYITNELVHTYDRYDVHKIEVISQDGMLEISEPYIKGDIASKIRDGYYKTLNIYIN